jgi:glycosyltransferase involved in cell wall biosynthesis
VSLDSVQKLPTRHVFPFKANVTVVIPAFNAAAFLGDALESVLAQTYQPLEVIVVDDGSEDETPQVAAAYASKVTYIRKERGGPAAARNEGIRAASGEWIAFQDADDIWLSDFLEKLVDASANTGADLVFCDALTLKSGVTTGPTFFERKGLKARLDEFAPGDILLDPFSLFLELHQFMLTCALLVRRDALLQVGLFDEGIYCGEDLDLWLRLSLRFHFAVVNEILVLRRIHDHNLSSDWWAVTTGLIKIYEKLERNCLPQLLGTRWRKILCEKKAHLLREQGARYLELDEPLLARKSWAKGFRSSYSPTLAAYWLATFLPRKWVEALRNAKRKVPLARAPISTNVPGVR